MRLQHGSTAAAVLSAVSVASPASAQHLDWRASITAAGTYNQTITDAPYPTALTMSGPSTSLSPSLSLVYERPRSTHTLSYTFALNLPFDKDFQLATGPLSYTNRLSYAGRYQLSELSSMNWTVSFSHSPTNTMNVAADPTQTALDAVPAGAAYLLGTSALLGFTRQLSQAFSLTESTTFSYNNPIDPLLVTPKTIGVQASLALNRQFTVDTLGVTLAVQTNYFTAGEASGAGVIDPRVQISNTLSGTWNRTITDSLNSILTLGATQVVSPAAETKAAIQPTGSAALNYRFEAAVATVSYSHMAAPNLATGAVNFTDAVTLRFSVPFGETGLTGTGSGGFTHMTPIGSNNGEATNTIMGDAALSWRPSFSNTFSISLRGQVQRQIVGADPLGAFTRIAGSCNLTYSYPSATAATAAPALPPALGMQPPTPSGDFGRSIEEPAEPREPAPGEPKRDP